MAEIRCGCAKKSGQSRQIRLLHTYILTGYAAVPSDSLLPDAAAFLTGGLRVQTPARFASGHIVSYVTYVYHFFLFFKSTYACQKYRQEKPGQDLSSQPKPSFHSIRPKLSADHEAASACTEALAERHADRHTDGMLKDM